METINSADFRRDCELILLGRSILGRFGIKDYTVELNSIGCRACRGDYVKILKDYLDSRSSELCPVCKVRKDSNTLRVLDCKEEGCRRVVNDAPKITKHLCGECGSDFDSLKSMLDSFDLKYNVNPLIVRGLDYYTKTVFEFVERGESLGSQSTLIGGGRYDLLSEELGGRPLPSCGFAGGVERLLLSIPAEEKKIMGELPAIDAFIVHFGGETLNAAFSLAQGLRSEGVRAEIMFESPKPKKQLSSASERSRYAVIIGENELAKNTVTVKDMKTQEQRELPLDAGLLAKFVRRGENA